MIYSSAFYNTHTNLQGDCGRESILKIFDNSVIILQTPLHIFFAIYICIH